MPFNRHHTPTLLDFTCIINLQRQDNNAKQSEGLYYMNIVVAITSFHGHIL